MSINLRDGLADQSVDHVLEDLLVRFVINVPDEDLSSIERVFFQVEEAQWFYTDFVRTLNPDLPSMKMKSFAPKILNKCPLLWKWGDPADALPRFGKYKSTIPVRGIAMLNKDLTKVVLLKGIESNTWSFPRGKISKGEADLECAIRETREETGFDAREFINEKDVLERTIYGKNFRIYLATGVPEDYNFEPLVRNEIAEIRWFEIKNLQKLVKNSPNKYFVVNTLLKPLTKWINNNKGLVSDEELMREAEIKLKALMGISSNTQVNADAGRELLDILQGAKPQGQMSAGPVAGFPVPPQQQQFIQMSLPQHLQSVYSGFAQMPQFFSPYTQGSNQYPVVSPPEFIAPRFENSKPGIPSSQPRPYDMGQYPQAPQAPQAPTLPNQPQASSNSKELLSILKGTAPPTKSPVVPEVTPSPKLRTNTNSAEELLSILKQSKPKVQPQEPVPEKPASPATRPETPSKKITLLKRDKSSSDSNASATLLGILGKKPSTTENNVPQNVQAEAASPKSNGDAAVLLSALNGKSSNEGQVKQANNQKASAELLGILNKSTTNAPLNKPVIYNEEPAHTPLSSSAELLNVLHQKKPTPTTNNFSFGESPKINEQPKIRLAKRGDDVPVDLKSLLGGERKSSEPSPQPPADLSAGNQILRLINKDSEAPSTASTKEQPENADDFEDFENFENFEDFDDTQGPPSHIYDLIHNTLDTQTDEEAEYDDTHAPEPQSDSSNLPDSFSQLLNGNKPASNHFSTYQNTYGLPNLDAYQGVPSQQPKRAPSTNGADILQLLKRT